MCYINYTTNQYELSHIKKINCIFNDAGQTRNIVPRKNRLLMQLAETY
jgi:hypothetical protein